MPQIDKSAVAVAELTKLDWQRFAALRIASLETDPEAFGGNYDQLVQYSKADWEEKFNKLIPLTCVVSGQDVALMTVENLDGDFGATCWIGGCWVNPNFRGQGIMRKMFEFIDANAASRSWQVQGLGVWVTNHSAIAAYKALGFVDRGERVPSTSKPGMFYQRMIRKTL